jgi:P27 family predicted phage terminase small subunit
MGARGPKRQPAALKLIRGNPGKRAIPEELNAPPVASLEPPADLDPTAQRFWREWCAKLSALGILAELDSRALTLLVVQESIYEQARAVIERDGVVVAGRFDNLVPSPWLATMNAAHDRIRFMLAEFGLTPAARTRIPPAKKPDASGWD